MSTPDHDTTDPLSHELSHDRPRMGSTPDYYTTDALGHDLYDLFTRRFGADAVQQHQQMVALEYLWRAGAKGNLEEDLRKALVVLQRALGEPSEAEKLPEKVVRMWCQANGYGLIDCPDPVPAARPTRVAADALADWSCVPSVASPRPSPEDIEKDMGGDDELRSSSLLRPTDGPPLDASVLEAAIWFFEWTVGEDTMRDHPGVLARLKHDLQEYGWPVGLHYHSHKVKLHQELPEWFPCVPGEPAA